MTRRSRGFEHHANKVVWLKTELTEYERTMFIKGAVPEARNEEKRKELCKKIVDEKIRSAFNYSLRTYWVDIWYVFINAWWLYLNKLQIRKLVEEKLKENV